MNIWIYIAIILFCIFSFWNIRCFLYQRTLLNLERTGDISIRNLQGVYPQKYLVTNKLSVLRFAALIYLIFSKWWIALICACVKYIIMLFATVNDSDHLKIFLKQIRGYTDIDYHLARKKAGEVLAYTDDDNVYENIGRPFTVVVSGNIVQCEIVDIVDGICLKEMVVRASKAFGINNSWPSKYHYLTLDKITSLKKGELETDFNHYVV